MANTTDILITSFFDEGAIDHINMITGLGLKRVTDGEKSGGCKVLSFECFGSSPRCIGKERIDQLIKTFKNAPFEFPENAVLIINDDNGDFTGAVLAEDK